MAVKANKLKSSHLKLIRTKKYLPLLLLAIIALAVFFLRPSHSGSKSSFASEPNSITSVDAQAETQFWSKWIESVGPEQAYADFKDKYANQNFGIQHYAAHVFGPLLYKYAGIGGVAVCDQTFAFGCYHSFFSRAISDQGLAVVPQIDKACLDKFGPLGTGCQHGIGHGLLEYFGPSQLNESLQACRLTTQKNPLFGCTSGVFMEYNVPIIIDSTQTYTQFRELNPQNPNSPCDSVSTEFRKSCFYEMGQWWDKVYHSDYKKLGELCQAVGDPDLRDTCYLGVGNVSAPTSDYDVAATIDKCKLMPNYGAQVTCRSGASWSFYAEPTRRNLSTQVCDGLTPGDQERCVQQADLIGERSNKN